MSKTREIISNKYIEANYHPDKLTVVIKAVTDYIPEQEFKDAFNEVKNFVGEHKATKIVFDKSDLDVFHQDSMTWYHVEWKAELRKKYNIVKHRKILPEDELFNQSVQIGREKIERENNNFKFADYDIQYKDSLEDAMNS